MKLSETIRAKPLRRDPPDGGRDRGGGSGDGDGMRSGVSVFLDEASFLPQIVDSRTVPKPLRFFGNVW